MLNSSQIIKQFHAHAKREFTPHTYTRWIRDLSFKYPTPKEDLTDLPRIIILTKDTYVQSTIETKYLPKIIEILNTITHPRQAKISLKPLQATLDLKESPSTQVEPVPQEKPDVNYFTPQYVFNNFVLGPSNQFAHAAAKAIVEDPGKCFNPLFLFGTSGLGKTHLIRAIGFEMRQKYPDRKVMYVPCEHFINDFNYYTKKQAMDVFRSHYRVGIDVLIIDDVQFLSDKADIQEEFFYTFNDLYENNKQIVITSDKVPKNLTGLEDRIRTRFEWGLIADIQPPEFETRVAIIRSKMGLLDLTLDDESIHFVANYFTNNVREMEGVLSKLKLLQNLTNAPLCLENIKIHLKPFLTSHKVSYRIDQILKTVASEFGCQIKEIKSNIKARDISLPRHISMYLIRKYTEKTYPEIGIEIGGKDHTTVIHGVKKISKMLSEDQLIKKQVEYIEEKLKTFSP